MSRKKDRKKLNTARIQRKLRHNVTKPMGYYESNDKKQVHNTKESGEISHYWLNNTPESSRTKGGRLTQEELKTGNNQIEGQNQ